MAGRLIGSCRGESLLARRRSSLSLSLVRKSHSGFLSVLSVCIFEPEAGAQRAGRRGEGEARATTKEDFIFGGPMTPIGASLEEEEERPVEHDETRRLKGQTRRKRNVLETRIMATKRCP